jgi:hypothetical protein
MRTLFDISSERGRHFLEHIRSYNNVLSLASIGCEEQNLPGFNPTFTIQGKMYHRIGSLLPDPGDQPKFMQMYFYDTDNELAYRKNIMSDLREDVLLNLQDTLHLVNTYIQSLKCGLELIGHEPDVKLVLNADKNMKPSEAHCRNYNLPQASEVAVLLPGETAGNLDVVLQGRGGEVRRINSVSRIYDPTHYVLMFPFGTDGFQLGLRKSNGRTLTPSNFYSYRLQIRKDDYNSIMKLRRLLQQYAVDQWAKIELSRMNWVRSNQATIRAEKYSGLMDAANENDLANAGQRIILPPSVYGSPRFYNECFQSAMSIVRVYGKPDYFITFTTNPKWKEIQEALNPGEKATDRPDICARVFHLKLDALMDDIIKKKVLGDVNAYTYTIEWQKRGLTHAHILLIMADKDKPKTPENIDRAVVAELPDPVQNPELFEIIKRNHIHGPCGAINLNSPCMDGCGRERKCTKNFPKNLRQHTTVREDSYPEYRRRAPENGGHTAEISIKGNVVTVDNSFVVPYNPYLSLRYNAHINVEVVFSVQAVKYLYKYVTKGQDRILMHMAKENANDEVENFLNARYVSASEAFWRIYGFELHSRYPAVEKLPCHLPDQQTVIFHSVEEAQASLQGDPPVTKLQAYFQTNADEESARTILYIDFPRYFTWNQGLKKWQRRKRGQAVGDTVNMITQKIGRVPTVSLSAHQSELFYLRLILFNRAGAKSFEDLRTIDGVLFPTFQAACCKLGLLDNDTEIDSVMEEASSLRFGDPLCDVFATILMYCRPSDPLAFWERHKLKLCQDKMFQQKTSVLSDHIVNEVLLYLQDRVEQDNLDINRDFLLPKPNPELLPLGAIPREIREETILDLEQLEVQVQGNIEKLSDEQRQVYDAVLSSVDLQDGHVFNLDASGGTGKTFTINLILDKVRSNSKIALATATSGIAATLLHLGRTLHSRLKVPLTINSESLCAITKRSATGKLLKLASLLVIDEVSMLHKHIIEAVDRTCQDIREDERPFGGLTVLLAGDFRQILPVVPHGSRGQIVDASLKSSKVWKFVKTLKLTKNMRVANGGGRTAYL